MIEMLGAFGVLAFFGAAIMWRVRRDRRERGAARNDTARAGANDGLDGDAAARNALDRTAWSRMYGP